MLGIHTCFWMHSHASSGKARNGWQGGLPPLLPPLAPPFLFFLLKILGGLQWGSHDGTGGSGFQTPPTHH
jgi:hypothetical protein